jgi:hypothetical protein
LIAQPFNSKAGYYIGSPNEQAKVALFTNAGHPGAALSIAKLQVRYLVEQRKAKPSAKTLARLNKEITEISEGAVDRYDDLASDPLP